MVRVRVRTAAGEVKERIEKFKNPEKVTVNNYVPDMKAGDTLLSWEVLNTIPGNHAHPRKQHAPNARFQIRGTSHPLELIHFSFPHHGFPGEKDQVRFDQKTIDGFPDNQVIYAKTNLPEGETLKVETLATFDTRKSDVPPYISPLIAGPNDIETIYLKLLKANPGEFSPDHKAWIKDAVLLYRSAGGRPQNLQGMPTDKILDEWEKNALKDWVTLKGNPQFRGVFTSWAAARIEWAIDQTQTKGSKNPCGN